MLAVLSSSAAAHRMKNYLASRHVAVEIVQTPKSLTSGGCGYSLRLSAGNERDVLGAAKTLRLSVKGLYDEEKSGSSVRYVKRGPS